MGTVLVTGAAGFVGAAAVNAFHAAGWDVRAAARNAASVAGVDWRSVGDIGSPEAWRGVTRGVSCVVHAAARVHIARDSAADSLAAFRAINVEATRRLALQAENDGVSRFVYVSSIGVNGTRTEGRAFTEADAPQPHNAYSLSKLEAEQALLDIARKSTMTVAIVRPPLVYGPRAPGNFTLLARWIARGLPLPLGRVTDNRRSLVFVDNLADALVRCASHPRAANRVFLVADREAVSAAELVERMSRAMGRAPRLWNVPPGLLAAGAKASGALRHLLDSLEVDTSLIRETLDWSPPFTLEQGLAASFRG